MQSSAQMHARGTWLNWRELTRLRCWLVQNTCLVPAASWVGPGAVETRAKSWDSRDAPKVTSRSHFRFRICVTEQTWWVIKNSLPVIRFSFFLVHLKQIVWVPFAHSNCMTQRICLWKQPHKLWYMIHIAQIPVMRRLKKLYPPLHYNFTAEENDWGPKLTELPIAKWYSILRKKIANQISDGRNVRRPFQEG